MHASNQPQKPAFNVRLTPVHVLFIACAMGKMLGMIVVPWLWIFGVLFLPTVISISISMLMISAFLLTLVLKLSMANMLGREKP